MRIAIDIRSLTDEHLTGVGIYTKNLIEALASYAPHDQFLLLASGSTTVLSRLPIFNAKNVQIVKVNLPNRLLSLLLWLPGGPTLERFLPEKPDVWLFPKFDFVKTRLPYFLTVHDLAFEIFPQFITAKDKLHQRLTNPKHLAEQAAGIFSVSASTKADLVSRWRIDPSLIHETPLGVEQNIFQPREQPSDRSYRATYDLNRPYILSLATHEPRKNLESVIEGYTAFRARGGRPVPLVLGGATGWKNRAIHELLINNPYQDEIISLGFVPEKHKPALYRGAICCLWPTFYEGFGLPVLEAMACGVPVITSTTSSLPEIVGSAGILINPFDVNDVTQALHELLDLPNSQQLCERLSLQGIIQTRPFTWAITATATYSALLNYCSLTRRESVV